MRFERHFTARKQRCQGEMLSTVTKLSIKDKLYMDTKIGPQSGRQNWHKNKSMLMGGLASLVVIAMAASFSLNASSQTPTTMSSPQPVPVLVVKAIQRDVPHSVTVTGTVLSQKDTVIRAQVDGILQELLFKEGDLVREGDLIATIDDRRYQAALDAARAQLQRDQATLSSANRDLSRAKMLLGQNVTSQQLVDQQMAQVEQLDATVAYDKANVEAAEINLSFTKIYSPTTGRVGLRQVDAGNYVRQADTSGIVSVVQMDPISVVFNVPQQIIAELRQHTRSVDGAAIAVIDRTSGEDIAEGSITAFDNRVGETSGTTRVRGVFDNRDERLSPGGFVSLRIQTGVSRNAVVVPKNAVRLSIDGNFVFRVRDGIAERVAVTVGYSNDDFAVVSAGIADGDVIVIDGYSRLRPSTPVRIIEDAPAKGSNGSGAIS
jgi:RND family efflux transporter MFP subunit